MRPAPLARPIVGLSIILAKLIFRYNNLFQNNSLFRISNVILAHINIKVIYFWAAPSLPPLPRSDIVALV